jgi:hypothetical protein
VADSFYEKLTAYSAIATAAIAAFALAFGAWQIKEVREVQREASARDAFKEYLKLAIDKPGLADASARFKEGHLEDPSYQWFVSYFLFSGEQIFLEFPGDSGWRSALARPICVHRQYLGEADFQNVVIHDYEEGFQKFINETINGQECRGAASQTAPLPSHAASSASLAPSLPAPSSAAVIGR